MYFNQEQENILKQLGEIAQVNLNYNDKRVANALCQALEILSKLGNEITSGDREELLEEFEQITEWDPFELSDQLLIACLNTSQCERGLGVIDLLKVFDLHDERDLAINEAAFLAALGRQEEAEQTLRELLVDAPDDLWLYIHLGDIYYIDTPLDEHKDFKKAEKWYYLAYDQKIGKQDKESWKDLLGRLGDVTISRLRQEAEERLVTLLEKYDIGTYKTVEQLRQNVYISSNESLISQHLQTQFYQKIKNLKEANKVLQVLVDAYNFMPQKRLDDLCPFEMVEYMPKGEHELRIADEMFKEYTKKMKQKDPDKEFGALSSQEFTDFQIEFMEHKDSVTGKKRKTIIDKERMKVKKDYESGKLILEGFVRYR